MLSAPELGFFPDSILQKLLDGLHKPFRECFDLLLLGAEGMMFGSTWLDLVERIVNHRERIPVFKEFDLLQPQVLAFPYLCAQLHVVGLQHPCRQTAIEGVSVRQHRDVPRASKSTSTLLKTTLLRCTLAVCPFSIFEGMPVPPFGVHDGVVEEFRAPGTGDVECQCVRLLESAVDIWTEDARRGPTPNFLALAAEPLAFRDERNAVAFLMNSKIAAVAEDDSIGIFAITIIAYRAFTVGFVAWRIRITVDRGLRA
ncbi:hypothetical protein KC325_g198 [Hortaea werneckii]|nr:hypothetical protein KC325_g198 [Hortaea werneckii]